MVYSFRYFSKRVAQGLVFLACVILWLWMDVKHQQEQKEPPAEYLTSTHLPENNGVQQLIEITGGIMRQATQGRTFIVEGTGGVAVGSSAMRRMM